MMHFISWGCRLPQATVGPRKAKDSLLQRSAKQPFYKHSASCQLFVILPWLLLALVWHQTKRIKEKIRGPGRVSFSQNQACHAAGAQCLVLIISCVTCSLLLLKYRPISYHFFLIFEKLTKCHLCSSFRKVVGGVNVLNVSALLVFSCRLIAGGSHFSKPTGCLLSSVRKKALILYCSLKYSVQGDKWQDHKTFNI